MRSTSRGKGYTYHILESLESENHEEGLFLVKGIIDHKGRAAGAFCPGSIDTELQDLDTDYVGGKREGGNWSASENPWDKDDFRIHNFYGSTTQFDPSQVNDRKGIRTLADEALQNGDIVDKMSRLYEEYRNDNEAMRAVKL